MGMLRSAAWIALAAGVLSACGGGGGGGSQPPPAGSTVTISGKITFDRIPFKSPAGLDPIAPVESPARQVAVQAIDASNAAVLASSTTDTNGDYSLSVPAGRNMFIRARAEMIKTGAAPTWSFSVRNNSNGDALYALDGSAFDSGTANSTRNLHAETGFGTTDYVDDRSAAPFAILDTVFRAKELILSASADTVFPPLRLFWSDKNRTTDSFCPDDGDIGTSSYVIFGPQNNSDDCNPPQLGVDGIYILGEFAGGNGDTDEFDQSVIAHEFGHYIEDQFSRTDSIGGEHSGSLSLLDLRVAFGEGWGNAFSGMVLGDPVYRDSFSGVDASFHIDLETDDPLNEGWFSEASVGEILWDVFDSANESGDAVALGFAPIYAVLTGEQIVTEALTSIFPFARALRGHADAPTQAAIDDLLEGEKVSPGDNDFGTGEVNDGGDPQILPIYQEIVLGTPLLGVCSRSPAGNQDTNKLGNRVFLRFVNDVTRMVTIRVDGTPAGGGTVHATDPDIFVIRQGLTVAFGNSTPPPPGTAPGTETISQVSLPAGTYVIEVYDFDIDRVVGTAPRCMTVSITG